MKKFLTIILVIISVCTLAFATACAQNENNNNNNDDDIFTPEVVSHLTLDHTSIELEKHEEVLLVAFLDDLPANDVAWTTSNPNVATIDNGKVCAIGKGTSVIIATYQELEARCLVKVNDNGYVPVLTTNINPKDSLCLINGDNFKVEYQVTYNNKVVNNAVVTMTLAENPCVDLVDGVLQAKAKGEAGTLIISANWKGLSSAIYVKISVSENALAQLSNVSSYELCNDARGGIANQTLSPTFIYQDEVLNDSQYSIISWEYDETVVSVDPNTLEITALGKGTTDVKATFKVNNSNVEVQTSIFVSVSLYNDDKTDTITADTVYLDRENYYLDVLDIYADVSSDKLQNVSVDKITDITGAVHYELPVENGVLKIEELTEFELSGTRKWQIECKNFSYIVNVPIETIDPATNIIGKYNPADWDYKMELYYDKNDVMAVFKDKTSGDIVDTGICILAPWKNNNYQAGRIVIDMNSATIAQYNIVGYYFYSSGCYQMSLAKTTSETVSVPAVCEFELYSETIEAPYANFSGNFETADDITFVLNEDKSVLVNGTIVGEYTLTPTAPLSGKINITLESALNGQTSFEGEYSYNKGSAEFDISINSVAKQFVRENSSDIYLKYANHKNAGWVVLRFFEDGTFVFDYAWDKIRYNTMGTYQLIPDADSTIGNEKGVVILDMVSPYNNRSHYEGTYYVDENGVYCIKFEPKTLLNIELVYKPR